MLRVFVIAATVAFSAQTALAADARLNDGAGRWVCQPDKADWPQVLIDFTEDAYRRCDQNTCVTYSIGTVHLDDMTARIEFAPHATFKTANSGGSYQETIKIAGATLQTSGVCAYRGLEDIYDPKS